MVGSKDLGKEMAVLEMEGKDECKCWLEGSGRNMQSNVGFLILSVS